MKPIAIACLALACAGCSSVSVSGQGGNAPSQTGARGGSPSVQLQNGSAVGVIVTVGILAALFGPWQEEREWHDGSAREGHWAGRIPPMLEGRAIAEVDCTQPIADWSKNLKCK